MEAEVFRHAVEPLEANAATCIPRLRGGVRRQRRVGAAPAVPTSVSVMDRLRDVLLRLAMLSAASTSPTKAGAGRLQQQATAAPSRAASVRMSPSPATMYPDSYRSEAVDECIEFLKRSAAGRGAVPPAPAAAVELVSSVPLPLHAPACAMGI